MKVHNCPACKSPMILTGKDVKWWLCPVCNYSERHWEVEKEKKEDT